MPDPIPCPKCGRLYVWDGARCCHKECRFGSTNKAIRRCPKPKTASGRQMYVRQPATSALDTAAIAQLFDRLAADKYGWRATLPAEFGTFFGVQITIDFETRPLPAKGRPPKVNDGEKELARIILLNLDDVLQEAERRFEAFNTEFDPDSTIQVSKPHIWISRGEAEEIQPNCWTLVIGAKGAPDFGCHIEFDGLDYREIWAGD